MSGTNNWDSGALVTLTPNPGSNSYTCSTIQNAATALFLYNASQNDHDITVTVLTNNASAPVNVTVPGVTGGQGLATIVLINGNITSTVTLTMGQGQVASTQVQAFIGSLAFPISYNPPMSNNSLPTDGTVASFKAFSRFYNVPASTWYALNLTSTIQQFFCAQFGPGQNALTIYCMNPGPNPQANVVQATPTNPVPYTFMPASAGKTQQINTSVFGNGQQLVWINADSVQNSQNATISMMKL